MQNAKLKKMVMAALFAALVCVSTMVFHVPAPMSGYVHFGDCFVLLAGWMLGPVYGAAAAGIGSMFADLLTGYAIYAPGTLVIKAAVAAIAALILGAAKLQKGKGGAWFRIIGGTVAESCMVFGYFIYAALLFGQGMAAAASIPGNIVQGVFGVLSATLVAELLVKNKIFQNLN